MCPTIRRSQLLGSRYSPRRLSSWDRRYYSVLQHHVLPLSRTALPPQLTVIQGDISELTVDCVVHPTSSTFNLTGLCGECPVKRRRYATVLRCPMSSVGTALRETGGSSFEAAVKEVSDKQSLSVGEGTASGSGWGGRVTCCHVLRHVFHSGNQWVW